MELFNVIEDSRVIPKHFRTNDAAETELLVMLWCLMSVECRKGSECVSWTLSALELVGQTTALIDVIVHVMMMIINWLVISFANIATSFELAPLLVKILVGFCNWTVFIFVAVLNCQCYFSWNAFLHFLVQLCDFFWPVCRQMRLLMNFEAREISTIKATDQTLIDAAKNWHMRAFDVPEEKRKIVIHLVANKAAERKRRNQNLLIRI